MPRKARIDAPGALHHIIVRGIERGPIFSDDLLLPFVFRCSRKVNPRLKLRCGLRKTLGVDPFAQLIVDGQIPLGTRGRSSVSRIQR
jgi:hypothetical protein